MREREYTRRGRELRRKKGREGREETKQAAY